jgi:large subunit ribosomal protein L20
MPRVKRGMIHTKRRKNILKDVKGYKWGRKKLIKLAKTARTKAGAHSYTDRRKKKRVMRGLWQIKINAFVRTHELSYSRFIDLLKKNQVEVDRKILAELAVQNKEVLSALIANLKQ